MTSMNPFSRKKFKLPAKECISPRYPRKVSDLVLELAQEMAPVDSDPDTFRSAVSLAVLLWNTPLLPEAAQIANLDRICEWLAERGRLDLQSEISGLVELRQRRYEGDHRMVVEYELQYEAKGPRLRVVSLDMDRPKNRDVKP